jgi:hypothetical protein
MEEVVRLHEKCDEQVARRCTGSTRLALTLEPHA